MPRLLVVPVLLLLLVVLALAVAAASAVRGPAGAAVCDAEGECRPAEDFSLPKFIEETTKDEDDEEAAPNLKQALTALMEWVVDAGDDELPVALVARWATPGVVVEAQGTPNVPWRGRYEGARAAASFPVKPMMVGVRSSCEVMAAHSVPPANAG